MLCSSGRKIYKEDGGGAVRKVWREVSAGTSGRRQYDVRSLPLSSLPPVPGSGVAHAYPP